MTEHFNQLSPSEQERLSILAEELGEAIQVIGKILRHGYDSHANRSDLEKELGDVNLAIKLLCHANDIDQSKIDERVKEKTVKILPYLHHQDPLREVAETFLEEFIANQVSLSRDEMDILHENLWSLYEKG